ncbi:MAG: methyltransferase domain-containing protein [Betaproteobacteria bacterium]|nr:methyltransferase domain-containing protein [Betaproteobacteria bacterium]
MPVSNLANKPGAVTAAARADRAAPIEGRAASGRPSNPVSDAAAFLRGFLARPMEVASVVPSSRFLEQQVVRAADLSRAACVVELGPGTGGSTRALLRAMKPQARLLAIELNPGFCDRLQGLVRDPRLTVQAGSANALSGHLAQWQLPAPDVVVSGIPFSTIPTETAQRIAAEIAACLAPGGRFVAYQFRPQVAQYLRPHLGEPDTRAEWRNLPPMTVFRWVKPGR